VNLRDVQIEAAREVLGWTLNPDDEYVDQMRGVLGEIVDAVNAACADRQMRSLVNPLALNLPVDDRGMLGTTRPSLEDSDLFGLPGGSVLTTHPAGSCSGERCVIHNPSDHRMRDWPLNWRGDRGLMERTCPHGVGHPDPDDIAHKARTRGDEHAGYESIHGCDGCCGGRP
jgi:hypothetical protein